MSLRESTIRGGALSSFERGVTRLLRAATLIVLARVLSREDFGVVAAAMICLFFCEVLASAGLGLAIIRKANVTQDEIDTAFWFNVIAAAVLSGAMVLCGYVMSRVMSDIRIAYVVACLVPSLILDAFGRVPAALLTRAMDFSALTKRSVVASFAGGVTAITFAIAGAGLWSLVAQQFVTSPFATLMLWRGSGFRPRLKIHYGAMREMGPFGVSATLGQLLIVGTQQFDEFLVGSFLGTDVLGGYSFAKRIIQLFGGLLTNAFSIVSYAGLSRVNEDPVRLARGIAKITDLSTVLVAPTFIGIATVATPLTSVFFGEEWIDTARILQFLAIAAVFTHGHEILRSAYLAAELAGRSAFITSLRLLSTLAGIPVVAAFGLHGLAAMLAVREILVLSLSVGLVRHSIPSVLGRSFLLPFSAHNFSAVLMSAAVMVVLRVFDWMGDGWQLFVSVVLGVIFFSLATAVVRPSSLRSLLSAVKVVRPRRVVQQSRAGDSLGSSLPVPCITVPALKTER